MRFCHNSKGRVISSFTGLWGIPNGSSKEKLGLNYHCDAFSLRITRDYVAA